MTDKTRLQRQILLAHEQYPTATHEEIADRVDCSKSYVGKTLGEYDDYDQFEALHDDVAETTDQIRDDVDRMFDNLL